MIGTYVYLLSRHDDNGLFAMAFATLRHRHLQ